LGLVIFGVVVAIERLFVPAHIRKRYDDTGLKRIVQE
jgi:hypothetical protein